MQSSTSKENILEEHTHVSTKGIDWIYIIVQCNTITIVSNFLANNVSTVEKTKSQVYTSAEVDKHIISTQGVKLMYKIIYVTVQCSTVMIDSSEYNIIVVSTVEKANSQENTLEGDTHDIISTQGVKCIQ